MAAPTLRGTEAFGTPAGSGAWPADPIPRRGQTIGRYIVLGLLGRGGMGVVMSAYDPELDRRVAVKLVQHAGGRDAESWPVARARLLREAKAMARLRHPNIVTVYDAGQLDDGTAFVAMDLVEGTDMRKWLATTPSTEAILATFIAAGRGLAAAHAAGIVHRDFKPDNVLVGDGGTVVVTDFGLASAPGASSSTDESDSAPWTESAASAPVGFALGLTATGEMLGTPAYMAPEQFRRAKTDARADVFAFCVALFEALAQARPFAGSTAPELVRSVCAGEIVPERAAAVPGWLLPILQRGLKPDPADRWPSMDDLLAKLLRRTGTGRRTIAVAAGGFGLLAAIALLTGPEPADCALPPDRIDALWGPDRQATILANFERQEPGFGAATGRHVVAQLDRYAGRWRAATVQACAEIAADEAASGGVAQLSCLESRLAAWTLATDLIEESTPEMVREAPDVADRLRDVQDCAEASVIVRARPLPTDPEARRALARAESLARQAEVLLAAGRLEDARKLHAELEGIADATDDDEIRIDALLVEHGMLGAQGQHGEQLDVLLEALAATLRTGDSHSQAIVLNHLIHVEGYALARVDAGHRWAALAEAAREAADSDNELDAVRLANLAAVVMREGDHPRALELLLQAKEIKTAAMSNRRQEAILRNLAVAFSENGRHDESLPRLQELLALQTERYGATHPSIGRLHSDLALNYLRLGDYEQTAVHAKAALEIQSQNGPTRDEAVGPLVALAGSDRMYGRYEAALQRVEQAHAIVAKIYGADHPRVAQMDAELARALREAGHPERAVPIHERELEALEQRAARSDLPWALNNAARTDLALGKLPRALERFEGALAVSREFLPDGSGPEVEALRGAGTVLLEMDVPSEAQDRFERALTLLEGEADDSRVFELRALRARCLARLGDPQQAIADLREAIPGLDDGDMVVGIAARLWLASLLLDNGGDAEAIDALIARAEQATVDGAEGAALAQQAEALRERLANE